MKSDKFKIKSDNCWLTNNKNFKLQKKRKNRAKARLLNQILILENKLLKMIRSEKKVISQKRIPSEKI